MNQDQALERSLEELDGERWGEPDSDATSLVRDCHRLRTIPIGTLTIGDLRRLLSQHIGTEWLIPLALDRLGDDPLAGDYYPGDLLNAVLKAEPTHWGGNPKDVMSLWSVRERLEALRGDADKLLARDDWPPFA